MINRIIPLLLTMTIHEVAHGYMALSMGDDTAKNQGRLTLNPFKHLDLMGTISMFLFKFGWAKPVPINVNNIKDKRLGMFLVSIAGVMANLLLATITIGWLVLDSNISYGLSLFLMSLMTYNVYFAIFNMLPFPPLDGSKVLASLLPTKMMYKFLDYEKYSYILLLVLVFTGVLDNFIANTANIFITIVLNLFTKVM